MDIRPLTDIDLPAATLLVIASFLRQRLATPLLPDRLADRNFVESMLANLLHSGPAVAAIDAGRLIGFLGSYLVEGFRGTTRPGAYVPEWGHATDFGPGQGQQKAQVYRRMYRAAAEQWAAAGCQVHAISLFAQDHRAEKIWFWNGFGLAVVDALRSLDPLESVQPTGLRIRPAASGDGDMLAALDAEHVQHYRRAPVFMAPRAGLDAGANARFLSRPKNSVWLALDGELGVGFLRFDGYDFDSVAVLESDDGVLITGAYVRPSYRRRNVATALLQAGLQHYAVLGLGYCAVNFESFNPEAASFWPKYFEPVCLSLMRVPET